MGVPAALRRYSSAMVTLGRGLRVGVEVDEVDPAEL